MEQPGLPRSPGTQIEPGGRYARQSGTSAGFCFSVVNSANACLRVLGLSAGLSMFGLPFLEVSDFGGGHLVSVILTTLAPLRLSDLFNALRRRNRELIVIHDFHNGPDQLLAPSIRHFADTLKGLPPASRAGARITILR